MILNTRAAKIWQPKFFSLNTVFERDARASFFY